MKVTISIEEALEIIKSLIEQKLNCKIERINFITDSSGRLEEVSAHVETK